MAACHANAECRSSGAGIPPPGRPASSCRACLCPWKSDSTSTNVLVGGGSVIAAHRYVPRQRIAIEAPPIRTAVAPARHSCVTAHPTIVQQLEEPTTGYRHGCRLLGLWVVVEHPPPKTTVPHSCGGVEGVLGLLSQAMQVGEWIAKLAYQDRRGDDARRESQHGEFRIRTTLTLFAADELAL